jgi:branched-chain amino acid transport system permease protein
MLVLALRRGRFGRRLAAMRDSPAATTMLGISIPVTKVVVFTISAGLAGLAGAIFGSLAGSAGPTDFLSFQSLPVLLLAMVGGVTTVSGALIGGLLFAVRGYISGALWPVFYLATGASAVLLARNPNGIAGELYDRLDRIAFWRRPGGVEPLPSLLREEVSPVGAA